jgi:hypothetical protein
MHLLRFRSVWRLDKLPRHSKVRGSAVTFSVREFKQRGFYDAETKDGDESGKDSGLAAANRNA